MTWSDEAGQRILDPSDVKRGSQALTILVHGGTWAPLYHGLIKMGFPMGLFHPTYIIYIGLPSHSIQKNGCSGAHLVIPRILAPKLLKTSTGTMSSYASCSEEMAVDFHPLMTWLWRAPFLVTLFSLKLTLRTRKWMVGILVSSSDGLFSVANC